MQTISKKFTYIIRQPHICCGQFVEPGFFLDRLDAEAISIRPLVLFITVPLWPIATVNKQIAFVNGR